MKALMWLTVAGWIVVACAFEPSKADQIMVVWYSFVLAVALPRVRDAR